MILYLYPEEWTGRRAREIHTLSTCMALVQTGVEVTLVTAGGKAELARQLRDLSGFEQIPGLTLVTLSRSIGPIRSAKFFRYLFHVWLARQKPFRLVYIIHLKAAAFLRKENLLYAYEAHEIFSETAQKSPAKSRALAALEKEVLAHAKWRIATSRALGSALAARYEMPDDFIIAPNAGGLPLEKTLQAPDGPFLYFGSLADWKGLDLILAAVEIARVPLKLVGGSEEEWERLQEKTAPDPELVSWQPRVALSELAEALRGARAGLIPTSPETGSGRYSCPMKLFDYARAGLPVLTTPLPSLESLDVGSWCVRVSAPTVAAWAEAFRTFAVSPTQAEVARVWAAEHTWAKRAELLKNALLL